MPIIGVLRPFYRAANSFACTENGYKSSFPPKPVSYELSNLPYVQCWIHSSPLLHDIPAEHPATFSERLSIVLHTFS